MTGKTTWVVPDGYTASTKSDTFNSHESVCILNLTDEKAVVKFTAYFEDREPLAGLTAECDAKRAKHIRMDSLKNENGESIPFDVPYAILVESSVPVICQYSRMDVTQPNMTLMTTIPY